MRVLLCAIVALPLVLFGVENADNASAINQQTLDSKDSKGDKGDSKDTKDSSESHESAKDSTNESAKDSVKDSANDSMQSPKSAKDSRDFNTNATAESPSDSITTNTTKEESGWMIGVGFLMGGSIGDTSSLSAYLNNGSKPFYYGAEVLLGHKTFFGESGLFGMRLYIDYNYRKTRGTAISAHFLGLNIDTLWNFTQSEVFKIGMLVGVRSGIGYGFGDANKGELDVDWSADLNIGARFVIYDHNAFELLLQPRFGLWLLKGKNSMYGIIRYVYTF